MPTEPPIFTSRQLPPIDSLLHGRPTNWQGLEISWSTDGVPVPVYLGRFLMDRHSSAIEAFLFAAQYPLADVRFEGEALGDGFFVEYLVVTGDQQGRWTLHRLVQRRSVTFSDLDETKDYVPAESLRGSRSSFFNKLPVWESASEAIWPTCNSEPMIFVGQVGALRGEPTRDDGAWDVTVYLFWTLRGRDVFKVVMQPCEEQTPEDHYAAEES